VLYFYPNDDTPTCTKEACNLRDNYARLRRKGFTILGVSPDTERSHQKFIAKYQLPFTLISDPDNRVALAYGVWGPKKFMGRDYIGMHRTTFVIDEKGRIEKIIDKVKSAEAADQILTSE
jgi:peroxiredoxin Q/BCP